MAKRCAIRSAGPADVAATFNTDYVHDLGVLIDAVDDAIVTAPRGVITRQIACEGFANSMRIGCQRAETKLNGSCGGLLRHLAEAAPSTPGEFHPIMTAAHAVLA